MRNRAIIDGDMLVYLAGFSSQRSVYVLQEEGSSKRHVHAYMKDLKEHQEHLDSKDIPYTVSKEEEVHPFYTAQHVIDDVVTSTMDNTGSRGMAMFLSGPRELCFRDSVATIRPYKGNRAAPKPYHYAAIRAYLLTKYDATTCYDYEADDALAMLADGNVMCTADKDLLQVPGMHYNFFTHKGHEITEQEAEYNLFHQILTGDSTDNIQGLPSVGVARATAALEDVSNDPTAMFLKCKEMYIDKYSDNEEHKGEDVFNEMSSLVYLLRSPTDSWAQRTKLYE